MYGVLLEGLEAEQEFFKENINRSVNKFMYKKNSCKP